MRSISRVPRIPKAGGSVQKNVRACVHMRMRMHVPTCMRVRQCVRVRYLERTRGWDGLAWHSTIEQMG